MSLLVLENEIAKTSLHRLTDQSQGIARQQSWYHHALPSAWHPPLPPHGQVSSGDASNALHRSGNTILEVCSHHLFLQLVCCNRSIFWRRFWVHLLRHDPLLPSPPQVRPHCRFSWPQLTRTQTPLILPRTEEIPPPTPLCRLRERLRGQQSLLGPGFWHRAASIQGCEGSLIGKMRYICDLRADMDASWALEVHAGPGPQPTPIPLYIADCRCIFAYMSNSIRPNVLFLSLISGANVVE